MRLKLVLKATRNIMLETKLPKLVEVHYGDKYIKQAYFIEKGEKLIYDLHCNGSDIIITVSKIKDDIPIHDFQIDKYKTEYKSFGKIVDEFLQRHQNYCEIVRITEENINSFS